MLCAAASQPPSPSCASSPAVEQAAPSAAAKKATRRGGRGGAKRRERAVYEESTSASSPERLDPASRAQACQDWLQGLEGATCRPAVLQQLQGRVLEMSLDRTGCRVIQAALEAASCSQAAALVHELQGSARRVAKCPYGNYVLQKAVQLLPASAWAFAAVEFYGAAAELARHESGCRVLCRLLEHGASLPPVAQLALEIANASQALRATRFGHHVLQTLLEHGTDAQRREVVATMYGHLHELAEHRNAAYVVEKALVFAALPEQRALALELFPIFAHFAITEFGFRVAGALLRLPDEQLAQQARMLVAAHLAVLQTTKYGRRLLEEVNRMDSGDH